MKREAQSVEQAVSNLETTFFDKLNRLQSLNKDFENIRSALDRLGEQRDLEETEASRLEWLLSTVEIGLADILDNYEVEEALEKAASAKSSGSLNEVISLMAQTQFSDDEIREVAESIGIDFDVVDFDQLRAGVDVELEHGSKDPETDVTGDDLEATIKIAWAHIKELPDYYDRLAEMEKA